MRRYLLLLTALFIAVAVTSRSVPADALAADPPDEADDLSFEPKRVERRPFGRLWSMDRRLRSRPQSPRNLCGHRRCRKNVCPF